ncbi:DUF881 domain-containing protein [Clostridium sp. 19966]|uniref:DUF881 domain-containing protein n=1 Tax=Clostridium sp. 19966 TaxID=2768166 RepID=UPI0028E035B7|nr:DUF881 domain-containing protein [Clostridium sp. 19966]MDT8716616.1 DUF881 domain-containing protein [Clostridium sp. 19966]
MKANEMKIFVFIACVIIGIMISMNISFANTTPTVILSAEQYKQAIDERTQLYNQISELQSQYWKNNSKLKDYTNIDTSSSKVVSDMKNELEKNDVILGNEAVTGKGLKIMLDDADTNFDSTETVSEEERWVRIIHNTDILEVINSLRNAGAQAISINDQRILSNSEVYCWGPFLKINNVNLCAPFYINVIGNSNAIKDYMTNDEGYLTYLKYRNIRVSVDTVDNVKIPAYIGDIDNKYVKETKK